MDVTAARRPVLVVALLAALLGMVAAPASVWADERPRDRAPGRTDGPASETMQALATTAEAEGSVRVLVELAVDVVPEGRLDADGIAAQRAATGRARAALARELAGTDHEVLRAYDSVPSVALEVAPAALDVLRAAPSVADVEVDERVELSLQASTEYIDAPDLWSLLDPGDEGAGYTVAVLDTGVDGTHSAFTGRIVDEACFSATGSNDAQSLCPDGQDQQVGPGAGTHCTVVLPACGHGTHVAGIVAGVAPGADIMPVQVFSEVDCDGTRCVSSFRSDVLAGLEYVLERSREREVAAANLSFGSGEPYDACDGDTTFKAMVDNLASEGVATVVSTGNAGWTDAISHPACISTAVAVGSTAVVQDRVSSFSNNHPDLVDLLAPGERDAATGEGIRSAYPDERWAKMRGTSMAAPHVAGTWALMRDHLPDASVATVLETLRLAGVAVEDTRVADPYAHPRLRLSLDALGLLETEPESDAETEPDSDSETDTETEPEPEPEPDPDPECTEAPFTDVGIDHVFCVEIAWMAGQGISTGYADGTFRPSGPVTRQAVAAFLHKLAGQPAVEVDGATFSDVGADHPFAEAIAWMAQQGISTGYADGTFRPDSKVTRQAVASFLHRHAGEPTVEVTDALFTDVAVDHPFVEPIAWMAQQGLSGGYADGTFRPDLDVARQAAASFLFRHAAA